MGRRRDNVRQPRTLWIVLRALVGQRLKAELRNGRFLEGKLEQVDDGMNSTWSEVSVADEGVQGMDARSQAQDAVDILFVSARQLVMVSIPSNFQVGPSVDRMVERTLISGQRRATTRKEPMLVRSRGDS
mmetsp:Transcript_9700/g.19788  ORF Transcript_9700/g.19788 Transcript_9700/m.19788 type:complete len:130 (+) Transcript_9700:70-459(+)